MFALGVASRWGGGSGGGGGGANDGGAVGDRNRTVFFSIRKQHSVDKVHTL